MRTWIRAPHDLLCGGPRGQPQIIGKGQPVQVITFVSNGRMRYRCLICADGEPPTDWPASINSAQEPIAEGFTQLGKIRARQDWKELAANGGRRTEPR